ncbi:hypothetical protein HU200_039793 [Digitaria exilis]|uniref:Uncharacterized protein n=1 Tax=Digitaria exilis TaxID=1010633 RepID=A0A835B8M6_9POAL|nr:hypothetical protein HU200_039793 [Digitaria exilis]
MGHTQHIYTCMNAKLQALLYGDLVGRPASLLQDAHSLVLSNAPLLYLFACGCICVCVSAAFRARGRSRVPSCMPLLFVFPIIPCMQFR